MAEMEFETPSVDSYTSTPTQDLVAFGLIYLVDSQQKRAEQIASQLRYFGYEVVYFNTTSEALMAMSHYMPTIILTALPFCETDDQNVKLVASMKSMTPTPPFVIALSDCADFDARLRAEEAGVDGFYTAPFDMVQIVDHLDQLMAPTRDTALRVLIIDDRRAICGLMASLMRSGGMETVALVDPSQIFSVMSEAQPDVILLANKFKGYRGQRVAGMIRQEKNFIGIPIILVCDSAEDQEGHLRYVPYADDVLFRTDERDHIQSIVRTRAQQSRNLARLVLTDSLTGLYKHSVLKDRLASEVERAKAKQGVFSFAMVDLDHFKKVNDTYGHAVGDRVILSLARLLRQNLAEGHIIGRYGGEEFGIIMPGLSAKQAFSLLETLRSKFENVVQMAEQQSFKCTLSCGIASFPRLSFSEDLIASADAALYETKRAGRNRVLIHPSCD